MSEDGLSSLIQDPNPNPNPTKRKRNLPGTPDPDAEVVALSPTSLMATNRFMCEVCNKGFQRDQNLQLHRRGHNLPWKLKQRSDKDAPIRKKVYVCPDRTCVHHHPSRALGDLTGIKKHFSRKHGEKKWKCDKCSKKYAVHSDWKAHAKICGTREYKCDCGTIFSRKDSFITHRAFCDALVEENARFSTVENIGVLDLQKPRLPLWLDTPFDPHSYSEMDQWFGNGYMVDHNNASSSMPRGVVMKEEENKAGSLSEAISSLYQNETNSDRNGPMSATALLQKAAQMGSTRSNTNNVFGLMASSSFSNFKNVETCQWNNGLGSNPICGGLLVGDDVGSSNLTRDFLGVRGDENKLLWRRAKFASMGSHCSYNNSSRNQ